MTVARRGLAAVAATALLTAASACGSDDADPTSGASSTLAPLATAPLPTTSTTVPFAGSTLTSVAASAQIVSFEQADDLLPPLTVTTGVATHVVELQNRTLSVTSDGTSLCVGGGEGTTTPSTCSPMLEPHGVLVYADEGDPRVYAVLTGEGVDVEFSSPGGALSCFSEKASKVGPLLLSWCEETYPPAITFTLVDGTRLDVVVG